MDEYESLLDNISSTVPVIEMDLLSKTGLKAAYQDNFIYIDKNLSTAEKKVNLSEEYSHYKTSVGDIINYNNAKNRKQEWQARRDSIERLVTLDDLIACSFAGCTTKYACADFLGITEEFLLETLVHYHTKYGATHLYKDYLLIFNDDSLAVIDTKLNKTETVFNY